MKEILLDMVILFAFAKCLGLWLGKERVYETIIPEEMPFNFLKFISSGMFYF